MFHTFPFSFVRQLQTTLNETLAYLPPGGMAELNALIDPAWIEQGLQASGKAAISRRGLPAKHAVCQVAYGARGVSAGHR